MIRRIKGKAIAKWMAFAGFVLLLQFAAASEAMAASDVPPTRCDFAKAFKPGADLIAGEVLGLKTLVGPYVIILAVLLLGVVATKHGNRVLRAILSVFVILLLLDALPGLIGVFVKSPC